MVAGHGSGLHAWRHEGSSDTAQRSLGAPPLSGARTRGRGASREVLAGQSAGLSWAIQVGADDAGRLLISMTCAYEGVTAASGMCATPLRGEQLIGMWISRAPGIPRVLLLWGAPEVSHATVLMARGDRICVALSPVIEDFRLCFGAAPLPAKDSPASIEIRSWRRGALVIELWRPPSRLGSGRRAAQPGEVAAADGPAAPAPTTSTRLPVGAAATGTFRPGLSASPGP